MHSVSTTIFMFLALTIVLISTGVDSVRAQNADESTGVENEPTEDVSNGETIPIEEDSFEAHDTETGSEEQVRTQEATEVEASPNLEFPVVNEPSQNDSFVSPPSGGENGIDVSLTPSQSSVAPQSGDLYIEQPRDPNRRLRNSGMALMFSSYGTTFIMSMVSMAFMGPISMSGLIPFAGPIMTATMFGFDEVFMMTTMVGLLSSVGQIAGLVMTCVGGRRMRRARDRRSIAFVPTGPTGRDVGFMLAGSF